MAFLNVNGFDINISEGNAADNMDADKVTLAEARDITLLGYDDWLALGKELKIKLNELCVLLGYLPIFNSELLIIDR